MIGKLLKTLISPPLLATNSASSWPRRRKKFGCRGWHSSAQFAYVFSVMGVTIEDIQELRTGWREPIVVGELPSPVRAKFKLRVPQVYLSGATLAHIGRKHPDITDFDLLFLTPTIEKGMIMQERKKANFLIAAYQDPASEKRWAAVMKILQAQCEVWLQSFHRAHFRQTKQWLKRCDLILMHEKS